MAVLIFICWSIVVGVVICLGLFIASLAIEFIYMDDSWRWGVRDDSSDNDEDEENKESEDQCTNGLVIKSVLG